MTDILETLDRLDEQYKKANDLPYTIEGSVSFRDAAIEFLNAYPRLSAELRRLAGELAESYKIIQVWQESCDNLTRRILAEEGER